MEQNKNVLVSGASFAGLTTAYWMNKMGYKVTVVEIGNHLKMGGTPVDIKDETVDIVKRMGIFEQIKAHRTGPEKWEFKNADDVSEKTVLIEKLPDNEFEIERDILLNMLFDLIKDDVNFIFNNSITSFNEIEDCIEVGFKDGSQNRFGLVFGCDGIHSAVRRIWLEKNRNMHIFLDNIFVLRSPTDYWWKKALIKCMRSQIKVLPCTLTTTKPTSFLPSARRKKLLMISVIRSRRNRLCLTRYKI